MTLPDLKSTAQLDTAPWSKGVDTIQRDLHQIDALSKKLGTIRLTIDLGQGMRDAQKMAQQVADMLRALGTGPAQSRPFAPVDAEAAALKARLNQLNNAVHITRLEFDKIGQATPAEIAELTKRMRGLQKEIEELGGEVKGTFGEFSNEARKAAAATRTAEASIAAATGTMTRFSLASQVKLGTSAALAQYGGQANYAASGLFQLALNSDKARVAQGLFEKTVQKSGQSSSQAAQAVKNLQDTLGVTEDAAREGLRGLLRQKYGLEEAQKALIGAGASALAAGRSAQEGMDAYVDAVTQGLSAPLNAIGISENLSTFYLKEAKARDTTVEAMTRQQKVQAELNLIMSATGDEVGDLESLLGGAAGNMNAVNREFSEAGKEFGQAFIPIVTNGLRQLTAFLDWFNDAPPAVQNFTTVLLGSAVAVGVLGTPIATLITSMKSGVEWIGKYRTAGKAAAEVGEALNTSAKAGAFTRMLDWVKASPTHWAKYRDGVLAASGANTLLAGSSLKVMGTQLLTWLTSATVGATAFAAVVGVAAAALGIYWVSSVRKVTETYEQADKANEESFNRVQKRIQELNAQGTELSRAQARYLNATRGLSDAQAGTATGKINWITGEREIKVDADAVKYWQEQVVKAKSSLDTLTKQRQAAATQGPVLKKLTDDETKALKELNNELSKRAGDYNFRVKLQGKTDLQKDILELGRNFDELREKAREIFKGAPSDPRLKAVMSSIQAEQNLQESGLRKKYADEAVKAAKESALEVQKAEISAMQEGRAKKAAERKLEIEELQRANKEEADKYKDFPEQYKQIVADGQREVAALKKKHRQEDIATAEEHAKRIQDAEALAAQSVLNAMRDGYAKQELARRLALDQLKNDIAERVKALEGDPAAQARVKASGQTEIANQIRADNLARLKETQDAQAAIRDAELAGADARIAALSEGFVKEEAVRALALVKLKESYRRRIEAEQGRPDVQKALMGERDDAVASLEQQNAQARVNAIKAGNDAVYEAQKAARTAEMALIKDDLAKKQAAQNEELTDLQRNIQKKLDGFRGTEEQRKKILEEGQRQYRALHKKHIQEDEADAKERAQRIADAWADVQSKQFAAQQASRARQLAQFEADAARRQLALKETPVAQAQAALDDIPKRFALQREAAQKQFSWEETQAALARDKALRAENLTAEQKKIIWADYNATLRKLSEDRATDEIKSQADQVEAARQAAEAMRLARIAEANKPVQQSENRQQELQWARDLSVSDAEILRINQGISAEREKQIQALQGQLIGLNGVILTSEERRQVEGQIKQLQHDQAVTLKEQQEVQRALTASALDRLDAEAQYAEKVARTSAELEAARRSQLAIVQARLRELDGQIAGEGREKERNDLVNKRFGLLGQIYDLSEKINSAPLDDEKRTLDLYKAQAETQLVASGLQDNRLAKAQLVAEIAARELVIANAKVAAAQNELAMQAALSAQAAARLSFAQAYMSVMAEAGAAKPSAPPVQSKVSNESYFKAQADSREKLARFTHERLERERNLENSLLDVTEARARALQVIRGEGENAVQNAELELQFTRERLALVTRQLDEDGTDAANRASLLRERLTLLQQEVEQERRVTEARRAAADLADELVQAESALTAALAGGQLAAEGEATRRLAQARQALTRAEEAYARARSEGDPGKIKDATEKLTSAIQAQRSAVAELADVYRQQIAGMDSVREASERLKQAAYGEEGPVFNAGRERGRLNAISQRRNAAQIALAEALKGGDTGLIQKATEELTRQQERVNKQIEYLNKNGQKVTDAGRRRTQVLSDQVDLLGISYDREAVNLDKRAQIIDQESRNAMMLRDAAADFTDSVSALTSARINDTAAALASALEAASNEEARKAATEFIRSTPSMEGVGGGYVTSNYGAPNVAKIEPAKLDDLAKKFAEQSASATGKAFPVSQVKQAVQTGTENALKGGVPATGASQGEIVAAIRDIIKSTQSGTLASLLGPTPGFRLTPAPTTQPAPSYSYVLNVGGISITAPSDKAADIRRTVNEALDDRIADARRTKSWGGNKCP